MDSLANEFAHFNLLPDPVQIVDRKGRIMFMNNKMRAIFGDLTGRLCYQAIKKSGVECENCPRKQSPGHLIDQQTEIQARQGKWMLVSHTSLEVGERVYILECYKDVTEYRRMVQEEAHTRAELEMAKEIQNRCMTVQLEQADIHYDYRYVPARTVAGDFLNATVKGTQKVWIAIADVSGHGAGAAAITFMIKAVYDQLLKEELPLKYWPHELNQRLYRYLFPSRFFTFTLLFLDLANRTYRTINAGHPPVLHLSSRHKQLKIQKAELPPVGTLEDMPIAPNPVDKPIDEGDRLLIYSDGLFQLFDNSFEDFLVKIKEIAVIPIPTFIERLLPEQMDSLQDDLTIFVAEV